MSGDTKILDQNPVGRTPVQPQSLVGAANKEIGYAPLVSELKPSGMEVKHEISPELEQLGVKEKKDVPELTFQDQQMGLKHSGETVPVPLAPTGLVIIPEGKDINSSVTWLNALTDKIQKVMKLMGI